MASCYCTNTFRRLIFIIGIGNIHKCTCRIIKFPRFIWAYNAGTIISDVAMYFEPCHGLIRPYIFLFNSLVPSAYSFGPGRRAQWLIVRYWLAAHKLIVALYWSCIVPGLLVDPSMGLWSHHRNCNVPKFLKKTNDRNFWRSRMRRVLMRWLSTLLPLGVVFKTAWSQIRKEL